MWAWKQQCGPFWDGIVLFAAWKHRKRQRSYVGFYRNALQQSYKVICVGTFNCCCTAAEGDAEKPEPSRFMVDFTAGMKLPRRHDTVSSRTLPRSRRQAYSAGCLHFVLLCRPRRRRRCAVAICYQTYWQYGCRKQLSSVQAAAVCVATIYSLQHPPFHRRFRCCLQACYGIVTYTRRSNM